MNTLSKKKNNAIAKYKITTLKHINPNNTSVFAHYKSYNNVNNVYRVYVFFKTSCNNISSSVRKDFNLGICFINEPIPFGTLMSCFNKNAYCFLKRKYLENN